jgi:putative tricarboxylic transport membrane protein
MSDDSAPAASSVPTSPAISVTIETAIGAAVLVVALVMMWGASQIPADAGYAGVGPNFLPWLVALALALCGVALIWQARTGGFAHLPEPSGAASGDWPALAWVVAGVVANATFIERLGFIISCGLCYMLAVRGLRWAEGKTAWSLKRAMTDLLIGLSIAAPVFWLFTKVLAVNLPALTSTGWL